MLSHVQCAGMNGDNYLGAFSEPVAITVEPPETQEGKTQCKQRCVKLHGWAILYIIYFFYFCTLCPFVTTSLLSKELDSKVAS